MKPGQLLTRAVVAVDEHVVDGAVLGGAGLAFSAGKTARQLQNGYVRSYALMLVIGVVLLGVVLVVNRLV